MKYLLLCFTLITCFYTTQAQKVNDALLLDMYQNQKYKEAADYLKSVYAEPITDMKVLSRFAYTYQMAGKPVDALNYYQRMYEQDTTSLPVLFNLAGINLNRSDNVKALGYYQKIIAIDSLNFNVNKQLGRLYSFRGDTTNTLKYYTKANKINPEEPEAATELSKLLIELKNFKTADKTLHQAWAADTTNIMLLRWLMKLNYAMVKPAETVKWGYKLLQLGDQSADVYTKMGSSYFQLKNYECCIGSYTDLPGVFQNEQTYYQTAMSYKNLKDYRKALEFFQQTLKASVSDNLWAYYSEVAGISQTIHKLKDAAANYQKSLFFNDKYTTLYSLASLYDEELKDKRNALKYFKKYLDSKPPAKDKPYIDYAQSRVKALGGGL